MLFFAFCSQVSLPVGIYDLEHALVPWMALERLATSKEDIHGSGAVDPHPSLAGGEGIGRQRHAEAWSSRLSVVRLCRACGEYAALRIGFSHTLGERKLRYVVGHDHGVGSVTSWSSKSR